MSIELKPHLEEINSLYERVRAFESGLHLHHAYSPIRDERCYIDDDLSEVIRAFGTSFNIEDFDTESMKELALSLEQGLVSLCDCECSISDDEYQLLYIFGRPFFHSLAKTVEMDDMDWEDGRCTVCGAIPCLSVLEKESPRRYVCSFCGANITIISLEGEEGMRADACNRCRTYFKTFEAGMLSDHSYEELDIMSIALDIILQEKGYRRCPPNPVGMRRFE